MVEFWLIYQCNKVKISNIYDYGAIKMRYVFYIKAKLNDFINLFYGRPHLIGGRAKPTDYQS